MCLVFEVDCVYSHTQGLSFFLCAGQCFSGRQNSFPFFQLRRFVDTRRPVAAYKTKEEDRAKKTPFDIHYIPVETLRVRHWSIIGRVMTCWYRLKNRVGKFRVPDVDIKRLVPRTIEPDRSYSGFIKCASS
jgi:hypothetical protein